MYACNYGERFPGTLAGAWQAKLHAEDHGHRLRPVALPHAAEPS